MRAPLIATGAVVLAAAGMASAASPPSGAGSGVPAAAYTTLCQQSGLCTYRTGEPTSADQWAGVDGIGGAVVARRLGGEATFVPTGIGAIAVAVNVPGERGGALRVRGGVLGQVFAGVVRSWNDPRLAASNPSLKLPNIPVTLCVPSGPSGVSLAVSHYLSKASPPFRARVGTALSPRWRAPAVVRVGTIAGVGACLGKHPGSIGFLPFGDAMQQGLGAESILIGTPTEGRAYGPGGRSRPVTVHAFVGPNTVAAQRATGSIGSPQGLADTTGSARDGAYPLTVLVGVAARTPMAPATSRAVAYFLSGTAQRALPPLGYAPLPTALLSRAKARLTAAK